MIKNEIISSFVCSIELMSQVINSQGLFVMQIEVDVYNLLKMWVYVQLHLDCAGSWKDVREQANAYFTSRASDYSAMNCFLETDEGKVFVPAFRSIRLHHVVNDLRSIQLLDTDRIIPQGITEIKRNENTIEPHYFELAGETKVWFKIVGVQNS